MTGLLAQKPGFCTSVLGHTRCGSQERRAAMSFIFISYSRQDQAYVSLLAQALKSHHLPFWLDINTDYGATWPHTIEKQVECCQVLVIVMSPRSKQSHWVQCELAHALELRKPIFPLLLEGPRWFSVAALQTVDVTGGKLPSARFFDTLRPHFPAPTSTAESTLIQKVATEAISADPAPVTWIPSTDRFHSSPKTDETNLSELWKDIISVLEPLGTRALMQQQGTLVRLTENMAQVVVNSIAVLIRVRYNPVLRAYDLQASLQSRCTSCVQDPQ